jgi:hypothetical protein
MGGSVAMGGLCENGACFWFSNNVEIPGPITLPNSMRTINMNITGQPQDVYAKTPWRAPGTAPVYGSGCGAAGGGPTFYANGGQPPQGIAQGLDGLNMPKVGAPAVWKKGSEVDVAWAISANHGGGYSYRLCKSDTANITEECFSQTPLTFGKQSWILYSNGSKSMPFRTVTTTVGTFPAGSEWARSPVPGCNDCDPYQKCGTPIDPIPGNPKDNPWEDQVFCYAMCDGASSSKTLGHCPDPSKTQYPEVVPTISGYGKYSWPWSIQDTVRVPSDLASGEYLLSWRWDCEESTQVWQNCADIRVVDA